ncbi:hypothetical protein P6U16_26635 (plasmid) [Rhizobium sp. 32-5/1]|uniref:hypothetical protein n=1 Tax=Rhizobium sp. 32-5/1 TaxID=3019602 RepID=UPI00240E68AC|nr:hypothetical protein [Rhizobium sp. 32-5/1]WEZ85593.1 hypothetical protein P6U16_26635 [Rhizobium sp. 32-5/1]
MTFKYEGQPPKSVAELKSLIASGKIILSGKLGVMARAMLEQPGCAAFDSAGSIAHGCGVSQSMALRLTRLLGFRSYQDLRRLFLEEVKLRFGLEPESMSA